MKLCHVIDGDRLNDGRGLCEVCDHRGTCEEEGTASLALLAKALHGEITLEQWVDHNEKVDGDEEVKHE